MKRLLSLAALFVSVLAAPYSDSTLAEWDEYKAAHDKFYGTPEEDARRLDTYLANKRKIEEHNRRHQRGETTFKMGINQFSDWFPEELDRFLSLKIDRSVTRGSVHKRQPGAARPKSINWVEKGAVTTVKNQLRCGSCYAFAAAGALEGLMFRKNLTVTSLSVQELMDCSAGCYGCNGGLMENCFKSVERVGEETEEEYPYEAKNDTCRYNKEKSVVKCSGYNSVQLEDDLQDAVGSVGPVAVGVGVSPSFFNYKSGIYDGDCSKYPNHGMLAVGYGHDVDWEADYWLVKNSWGTGWGEEGYVRMMMHEDLCYIGDYASYPV